MNPTMEEFRSFVLVRTNHPPFGSRIVFQFKVNPSTGSLNHYGRVLQYVYGSPEADPGFYVDIDGKHHFFCPTGAYDAPMLRRVWKLLIACGNYSPEPKTSE